MKKETADIQKALQSNYDSRCLIWSDEYGAWWRSNCKGYTTSQKQAGMYKLGEAYENTRTLGEEKRIFFWLYDGTVIGLHHEAPRLALLLSIDFMNCQAGCSHLSSGETIHRKDCPNYKKSYRKIRDDTDEKALEVFESIKISWQGTPQWVLLEEHINFGIKVIEEQLNKP